MGQVDVDAVQAQPLEARLQLPDDPVGRQPAIGAGVDRVERLGGDLRTRSPSTRSRRRSPARSARRRRRPRCRSGRSPAPTLHPSAQTTRPDSFPARTAQGPTRLLRSCRTRAPPAGRSARSVPAGGARSPERSPPYLIETAAAWQIGGSLPRVRRHRFVLAAALLTTIAALSGSPAPAKPTPKPKPAPVPTDAAVVTLSRASGGTPIQPSAAPDGGAPLKSSAPPDGGALRTTTGRLAGRSNVARLAGGRGGYVFPLPADSAALVTF